MRSTMRAATRAAMRALRVIAAMLACVAPLAASAGGCTTSTTGLAFGAYQPLTFPGKRTSTDRTSTASISIICTGVTTGGSYTLSLGPSIVNGSTNPRYLTNPAGGPNMQFNVYTDAGYNTVWGDGGGGSVLTGAIPAGDSNQSHTVYGKVPAGQNQVRVGTYSGQLTMTLTYNP